MSRPRLLLLLLIVLFPPVIAYGGLVAGPPRPVSMPPLVPPPGLQSRPELASSGRGAVAVWIDSQSGREGIYAARLTANGERVPASQRRLRDAAGVQNIALCWTGRAYVATWYEPDLRTAFAAALDGDGTVVTAPHAIVANGSTLPRAIAWNGREALVAYVELSAPNVLRGVTVDAVANVLRSDLLLGTFAGAVALASDGEAFYLFTATRAVLAVARLEARGTAVQLPAATLAAGNFAPAVGIQFDAPALAAAFDGRHFAVVAIEEPATLRRFFVDPATLAVTPLPSFSTGTPTGLALSAIGNAFAVAWTAYDPAHERYIVVGNVFDGLAVGRVLPRDAFGPVADVTTSWTGTRLLFAWTARTVNAENGGRSADVVAAASRTTPESVGDPFPLALAPQWQEPSIAASGEESIVVWREPVADGTAARLFAIRLVDGIAIGVPVALTPRDVDPNATPGVVFTGAAYLVFWSQFDSDPRGFHVYARRLSRTAELLDDEPLLLGDGAGPSAASNGTIALLAFGGQQILGIRFDADARALPEPPHVLAGPGGTTATASIGRDFLVAFEQGSASPRSPFPNLRDLAAVRVDAEGFVLDSAPAVVAATARDEHDPAVAGDGRDSVVAYSAGTLDQTITIASGVVTEHAASPATLAFAGGSPFAAWYERTASSKLALRLARQNAHVDIGVAADVSGARVSLAALPNGAVELAGAELIEGSMRVVVRRAGDVPPRARAVRH